MRESQAAALSAALLQSKIKHAAFYTERDIAY